MPLRIFGKVEHVSRIVESADELARAYGCAVFVPTYWPSVPVDFVHQVSWIETDPISTRCYDTFAPTGECAVIVRGQEGRPRQNTEGDEWQAVPEDLGIRGFTLRDPVGFHQLILQKEGHTIYIMRGRSDEEMIDIALGLVAVLPR